MGCIRWFIREDKNKVLQKIHVWETFSSKGIIKLQFFTAKMDSKKYIEIIKNCKSDIDNLHPSGILFLWDNDSKHNLKVPLDYYIENKIQLLVWPAYSPDLNPIEKVLANIKYKLSGNVYRKIQSLKSNIEEYCISCATHLSSIIDDFLRKWIEAWILSKGKRRGNQIFSTILILQIQINNVEKWRVCRLL